MHRILRSIMVANLFFIKSQAKAYFSLVKNNNLTICAIIEFINSLNQKATLTSRRFFDFILMIKKWLCVCFGTGVFVI